MFYTYSYFLLLLLWIYCTKSKAAKNMTALNEAKFYHLLGRLKVAIVKTILVKLKSSKCYQNRKFYCPTPVRFIRGRNSQYNKVLQLQNSHTTGTINSQKQVWRKSNFIYVIILKSKQQLTP